MPTSRNEIRLYPAANEGLSRHLFVQGDRSQPERVLHKKAYSDKIRRIKYFDEKHKKNLVFLTNHFSLPALTVAELYRCRWKIELFFKLIKQHLRIKAFYGTSKNDVKIQIWVAITVYVLVAIVKNRLQIELSLYTILQILSIALFKKIPIYQLLTETEYKNKITIPDKQLKLFQS